MSLGLEETGRFKTIAFCEIEPFAQKVLAKHWPEVMIYDDVRTITGDRLKSNGHVPDVITGGFPCTDLSKAGEQAGIHGQHSGLWREYARIIDETRPRYIIVENVPNLLSGDGGKWYGQLLRDLAALGYDAEWHCIPAAAIGAFHIRDRVWILAHARKPRLEGRKSGRVSEGQRQITWQHIARLREKHFNGVWKDEPRVGRVVDGLPDYVDRIKCLGNAIVPQLAELMGQAIIEKEILYRQISSRRLDH